MNSKEEINIEIPMEQFVRLSEENLVNVFLENALKNKDKEIIQNTLCILLYAYPNNLMWRYKAYKLALRYHNFDFAKKLIDISKK